MESRAWKFSWVVSILPHMTLIITSISRFIRCTALVEWSHWCGAILLFINFSYEFLTFSFKYIIYYALCPPRGIDWAMPNEMESLRISFSLSPWVTYYKTEGKLHFCPLSIWQVQSLPVNLTRNNVPSYLFVMRTSPLMLVFSIKLMENYFIFIFKMSMNQHVSDLITLQ